MRFASIGWETFIEHVVTPRFPAGFTIFNGAGQWRNTSGRVEREPSKVLVILHPRGESIAAKIDEVRHLYCERFKQESVMKVTSAAQVRFAAAGGTGRSGSATLSGLGRPQSFAVRR